MLREGVADIGHAGADPQRADRILHRQDATCAGGLGLGGERPVGQQRIQPSGLHLLGQQRRRAEALVRGGVDVDAEALRRVGAKNEPALVERTAGDAERVSRQIGHVAHRRIGGRDQCADGVGERDEGPVRAGAALTRHPQPIDHDHVDLAGLQCDLRGLRRRQLHRLDRDVRRGVQCVVADHVDLPRHRAEAQHADADRRRRCGADRYGSGRKRRAQQRAPRNAHRVFLPEVRAIIPAPHGALSMGVGGRRINRLVEARTSGANVGHPGTQKSSPQRRRERRDGELKWSVIAGLLLSSKTLDFSAMPLRLCGEFCSLISHSVRTSRARRRSRRPARPGSGCADWLPPEPGRETPNWSARTCRTCSTSRS